MGDRATAVAAAAELQRRQQQRDQHDWNPLPHQIPPDDPWRMWLLLGGRGSGKTDATANWAVKHLQGPPCDHRAPGGHRGVLIGPTLSDVIQATVQGPSGLRAHYEGTHVKTVAGGSVAVFPNGAEALLVSGHTIKDTDRLRAGGNRCFAVIEELAAINHLELILTQLQLGLRLGTNPQIVASTTPRPRRELKALTKDPTVQITSASSFDNPHLPDSYHEYLRTIEGSRMGRQEIHAEILDDVEGAMWRNSWIVEADSEPPDQFVEIVVGVDPAGSTTARSDETGVVVAGEDTKGLLWVLEDLTGRYTPGQWAGVVADAVKRWGATTVAVERNFGGDMVRDTLLRHTQIDGRIVEEVRASRGKTVRAQPISMLYEPTDTHPAGSRVVHASYFPELTQQMTEFTGSQTGHDDRVDALVWGMSWLTRRAAPFSGPPGWVDNLSGALPASWI